MTLEGEGLKSDRSYVAVEEVTSSIPSNPNVVIKEGLSSVKTSDKDSCDPSDVKVLVNSFGASNQISKENVLCPIVSHDMSSYITASGCHERPTNKVDIKVVEKGLLSCDHVAEGEPECKRSRLAGNQVEGRRKKMVILLMYSGKDFYGMQRSPGVRTIEDVLLRSLMNAGAIGHDAFDSPILLAFQRAARTDKGVSAAGQVVSLKLPPMLDGLKEQVNSFLPPTVKVLDIFRTTRGFDGKGNCFSRTYSYILPTFAFAPCTAFVTEAWRITPDILRETRELLARFKGTKNYFNYTSGRKVEDASCKRYIMDCTLSDPWMVGDMEFVRISIIGQSFMLHQIRKMVGMAIGVIKGFANLDNFRKSWGSLRVDIPRAPGLGLLLEMPHYNAYNNRYGADGIHKPIEWDNYKEEREAFKENFIYRDIYTTEREQRVMLHWLGTLPMHHFDVITTTIAPQCETSLGVAAQRAKFGTVLSSEGCVSSKSGENVHESKEREVKEINTEIKSDNNLHASAENNVEELNAA